MKYFNLQWYKYLFSETSNEIGWILTIWCRLRKHPAGISLYYPGGLEPGMRCKNCGDDLGIDG
ncbi:hypothetical protein LCGC14_1408840 [marine sediment metagenome]|uniref:Uncharacterized protein n=1 Tax=marine sediment metagenome TaxID=412755 RepID=A0A0F9JUW4_9ZZZZ